MSSSVTLDRPAHLLPEERQFLAPASFAQKKCATCRVSTLCLPGGLSEDDLRPLQELSLTTRQIKAGQTVFRDGDPFRFLYAVRRGTCKTVMTHPDGREQVAGFHIAGEVLGLEGLALATHAIAAVALEDSEVCLIPYRRLLALTAAMPQAHKLLAHLMGQEIGRAQSLMLLLGLSEAPERFAAFLVNLSERYAARGYSPREMYLRMNRAEIASFLGVQPETISRMLALFQRKKLVEVKARQLRIVDLDALKREYEFRIR